MADAALDLSSKPLMDMSPHTVKPDSPTTSPSMGMHRSNSTSSSSDGEFEGSSSHIKPGYVAIPTSSFDSSSSGENVDDSSSLSPKPGGSSRAFKRYPMDIETFSMFSSSSPLMVAPSSLSSTATTMGTGMGLFDGSSSPFPTFPLTPLTSHLMQRKRRAENRSAVAQEAESLSSKKTKPIAEDRKDDAYWERRRKNNEAAKRSRDTRRQKEEEIALRAVYLQEENMQLRAQVAVLKNETAKLQFMLYNRI
ncbi:hypothetical protein ACJMK2_037848 [Sinanodonta woodiana]|uniref:BZIP domain-containing protein n=1 Tax=Sinanodonta woodiana TaxID=1069815 RepID=A0ABD3WLR5_SINWO